MRYKTSSRAIASVNTTKLTHHKENVDDDQYNPDDIGAHVQIAPHDEQYLCADASFDEQSDSSFRSLAAFNKDGGDFDLRPWGDREL